MALHFDIKVNSERIGWVYIRRLHALQPGVPSVYSVVVECPLGKEHRARVEHTYEDGALVLVAKALQAAGVKVE